MKKWSKFLDFWCATFHKKFHQSFGWCLKCHRILMALALMLACGCLHAQSNMNFDKLLIGTDKMIYIQPPPGKVWTITAGSLTIERLVPGASINVWTDSPPFNPNRDPVTGEMIGCFRCLTLIRLDAGAHTFIPIVGGYSENLHGQDAPIVIAYPNRLMLAISPAHGGLDEPLQTLARFSVKEVAQ